MLAPARVARSSSCRVDVGVRGERSSSWMRCQPRFWRRCSRNSCQFADGANARRDRPIAPARADRSSLAARCSKPPLLRHSHRGSLPVGHIHRKRKGSVVVATSAVALRQTSRPLVVWWCRECGCRPSLSPSDRDKPALPPDSQSVAL